MLSAERLFFPEGMNLTSVSKSDGPRGKLVKSKDLTTIKQKSVNTKSFDYNAYP